MHDVAIVQADLTNPSHQEAFRTLSNLYAQDEQGQNRPLAPEVLERLPLAVLEHPTHLVFLAFVDDVPAGIATCFIGFSTFNAKPLINIHDLAVRPDMRNFGLGRRLLEAVENHGRAMGFCKITLEASVNNPARRLYERYGFKESSVFYTKQIDR
jgi:ribosomal protein S18 acetylase RimI-like enzyme